MASERLEITIDANASPALRELGKVEKAVGGVGAQQRLDVFDRLAQRGTGALSRLGLSAELTGGAIKAGIAGAATAAATAIGQFAAEGVRQFVALATEVRNVQRVTGATAEDASRLRAVLDDYAIPVEAASAAFGRLSRTVANTPDALRQFGVEVARTSSGALDVTQTLARVADAYAATEDPAARAALGTAAFGRGYQALIPILEGGSERIREALQLDDGQVLSQEQLDRAERARLAFDELSDATQNLQRAVGEGLVPALAEAASGLSALLEGADDLAQPLGGLAAIVSANTGILGFLGRRSEESALSADDLRDSTDRLAESQRRNAGVTSALVDRTVDLADVQKDLADTAKDFADATRDLSEAQRDLERLRRTSASDQTRRAELDYRSALLASADAADRARDAARKLDRQRRADASGLTRDKLLLNRADAQERLLDAQALGGTGDPYDALRASVGVREATLDLEDAATAIQEYDAGQREATSSAQRAADQAAISAAQTRDAVTDAYWRMTDAAGDYAEAVEDAERRVTEALAAIDEASAAHARALLPILALEQDRLYGATRPGPGATYSTYADGTPSVLGVPSTPSLSASGMGSFGAGVGGPAGVATGPQSMIDVFGRTAINVYVTVDGSNLTAEQLAAEIDRKGSFMAGAVRRF